MIQQLFQIGSGTIANFIKGKTPQEVERLIAEVLPTLDHDRWQAVLRAVMREIESRK